MNAVVHEQERRAPARRVTRRKEVGWDGELVCAAVRDFPDDHLGPKLGHEREIGHLLEQALKIELIPWRRRYSWRRSLLSASWCRADSLWKRRAGRSRWRRCASDWPRPRRARRSHAGAREPQKLPDSVHSQGAGVTLPRVRGPSSAGARP